MWPSNYHGRSSPPSDDPATDDHITGRPTVRPPSDDSRTTVRYQRKLSLQRPNERQPPQHLDLIHDTKNVPEAKTRPLFLVIFAVAGCGNDSASTGTTTTERPSFDLDYSTTTTSQPEAPASTEPDESIERTRAFSWTSIPRSQDWKMR